MKFCRKNHEKTIATVFHNRMNLAIVSGLAAVLFFALKMALNYANPSPKDYIQDAVLACVSCAAGVYGYNLYFNRPVASKTPVVFTEKPNF